jgi:hypothetical protein
LLKRRLRRSRRPSAAVMKLQRNQQAFIDEAASSR